MSHNVHLTESATVILTEEGAKRLNKVKGRKTHVAGEKVRFPSLVDLFHHFGGTRVMRADCPPFYNGEIVLGLGADFSE